jgi:hypothetical protein
LQRNHEPEFYISLLFYWPLTFFMINAVPHQLRKSETKFISCEMDTKYVITLTVEVTSDPLVSEQLCFRYTRIPWYHFGKTEIVIEYDNPATEQTRGDPTTESIKAGNNTYLWLCVCYSWKDCLRESVPYYPIAERSYLIAE